MARSRFPAPYNAAGIEEITASSGNLLIGYHPVEVLHSATGSEDNFANQWPEQCHAELLPTHAKHADPSLRNILKPANSAHRVLLVSGVTGEPLQRAKVVVQHIAIPIPRNALCNHPAHERRHPIQRSGKTFNTLLKNDIPCATLLANCDVKTFYRRSSSEYHNMPATSAGQRR